MKEVQYRIEKFYIHFNQDEHYMPIEDYEKAIKATKTIFENVTKDIIKSDNVDLVISAPKNGGLVIDWGFVGCMIGLSALVLQFIESETGKHIIKRYWNKTPVEIIDEKIDDITFIKNIILSIFKMSHEELKKIIDEIAKFNEEIVKLDKSLKAVSDFYQMCNKNKNIKSIGFSQEHKFDIERKDFYSHLSNDIIRDLGIHNEYKSLTIVKPVTKRKSKGKWTLSETGTNEEQNYTMNDEKFKEKTLNGDFVKQNPEDDEILALVEYDVESKNGYRVIKDRKVLEIYEFNKEKFENRELPNNFELNKAKKIKKDNNQLNLFEHYYDKENEDNNV